MSVTSRLNKPVTLTIASGSTASDAWDIGIVAFGSLLMPAALTGISYAVEGRFQDSGSWFPILDSDGTVLTLTHVNDSIIRVPDAAFACDQLRFVSSASEAAARTLEVYAKT